MPIRYLHRDKTEICSKYSLVGHYATRPFVKHAALLKSDTPLIFGAKNIFVWHMGPPLVAGAKTTAAVKEQDRKTSVHIVGFIDLDADDLEGIETWLTYVDKEDRSFSYLEEILAQYRVSPPVHWVYAENGTPLRRQFTRISAERK